MAMIWDSVDKSVQDIFEDLGLTEYYSDNITVEKARNQSKKRVDDKKDIPWCFIENALNPCYDGRSVFFQGQQTDRNGSSSEDDFDWEKDMSSEEVEVPDVYSSLDVSVVVLLCCNYACKQLLAQKLHESELSVPIILPDIADKDVLIVQSSVLRGITKDVEYDRHIPIVSFVSVNGRAILKTKLLNTLLVDDAHKPFFDIELERNRMGGASMKRIFSDGLIDAALSRPHECTCKKSSVCSCTFKNTLLFLNLYGMSGDFKLQKTLICKISALVTIVVDTGKLAGETETINNIKEIIDNSKQVLIVFTKEEDSLLDHCKKGVQELTEVIKGSGAQVIILYHRGTGNQDNMDMIRGNMKKKINSIIEKLKGLDNTSLKEHFENLNMNNVRSDESET